MLHECAGYNEASGMLQTIERYDGATWETVTEVQLVDAKVTAINLLYY